MGSNSSSGGGGGGRTDAGPKRTTATKIGVGNINEKGQKTKTTFAKEDDTREGARSTNYTTQPKKSTFKTSKKSFDDATGKSKLDNYQVPKTGSLVLNSFQKARQKMFETNRKFFQEKVLTSKNRGNYEDTFDSYSSYIDSRMSGKTDAYGNTIYSNSNNDNQVVQAPEVKAPEVKAPKSIEVSQVASVPEVTAEEARATANELIRKRRRGRGRSLSMLQTSSEGLNNEGLTLSKKSLLG